MILFLCNTNIECGQHGTETKEWYNMVSKIDEKPHCGTFLSMLVHDMGTHIEACPYYKRMRHRFSVCNSTYLTSERELKSKERLTSYASMLGNIKESKELVKVIHPDTIIPDWYDVSAAIVANAAYDSVDRNNVEMYIGSLIHMMQENKCIPWNITHYISQQI